MPRSVEDLLSRLTLEEKVAQLSGPGFPQLAPLFAAPPDDPGVSLGKGFQEIAPHGIGHLAMLGSFCPDLDDLSSFFRSVQDAAMTCGRFPIPALIHLEALNGLVHPGAPTYPTGIGQAATWNPALTGRMATHTRERMRAMGVRFALSPVLDISRDPRWGRVHETYGEDPDLSAAFGVAFVRGMQSEDLRQGVAACGKHFIGYAASQGGLNCGGVNLGPRTLREQYARPFEAAIREAGLATVMNSYAEVDGLPVAADPEKLGTLLRDELGFTGVVVSDYASLDHLTVLFHLAPNLKEAGRIALGAGIDVEFPEFRAFADLAELVREGTLDESVVDRSARRVLELKERLGLLDHLLTPATPVTALPAGTTPKAEVELDLSRAIAAEAVVLLRNDGVLPLRQAPGRVAVIGELAAQVRVHYGAYSGVAAHESTVSGFDVDFEGGGLDDVHGMRLIPTPGFPQSFEKLAREVEPHAVGVSDALEALLEDPALLVRAPFGGPEATTPDDLARATDAATGADVAIVVVGERTGWVGDVTAGEQVDRQDLRLPGDQEALVEAVAATGTPTVVVVISGRPLLLDRVTGHANAVLWAPLLGPAAGPVLADALLGRTAPAGRLPVSFPASIGQLPVFHGSRAGSGYDTPGGAEVTYVDGPARPLFPFGHGLTYTHFTYAAARPAAREVMAGGDIEVSVDITNSGDRDADEVVQLYARDVVASTVRPVRQLLAFTRVHIPAGATKRVRLTAPVNALALIDPHGLLVVEPGEVDLMIGASSSDIRARTTLTITGAVTGVPRDGRFLGSADEPSL
ncbi:MULTISPECIES: glycoside hydrolase family 3 N-terminal domain-containing protein [unclassified Streptomyces]|uniref:glycoside hydrolase family 3 N-terminal domain-containing protein n=1 Tax=unclassified Streptomyces TaxID=2593676 RepID=UPI003400A7D7